MVALEIVSTLLNKQASNCYLCWCEQGFLGRGGIVVAMRICLLSPYPELIEGIARYTHALLRALEKLEGVVPVAVPFHSSDTPTLINELQGIGRALRTFGQIVKHHPDILHVQFTSHAYPKLGLLLLLQLSKLSSLRLVVTRHEFVPEKRLVKIRTIFERIVCNRADLLIVLTEYSLHAARCLRLRAKAMMTIPHGLRIPARIGREEARARLGIPPEAMVLLTFGYLSSHKGLEYAIRAMKSISKTIPKCQLIVAGGLHPSTRDDSYARLLKRTAIEDGVTGHVTFAGHVPDELVDYYFESADIVLLPYLRITQSGVLYTAVAHRVPVIASSVGGIREELRRNQIGVLVPPGEVNPLIEAVIKLLGDPKRLALYSENEGRLSQELAWGLVAKKHLEAYRELKSAA
jgi:glycosyltransferase involved in cell wall biosynthesis